MEPGPVGERRIRTVRGCQSPYMLIDPLQGWRTVNVTGQHISRNIAGRVRLLADEDYPKAKRIVLIVDHVDIRIYS